MEEKIILLIYIDANPIKIMISNICYHQKIPSTASMTTIEGNMSTLIVLKF